MTESVKKSYNPFRMWGSWLGFSLPLLLIVLMFFIADEEMLTLIYDVLRYFSLAFSIFLFDLFGGGREGAVLGVSLASLIQGFILGWIINSFFRKFSK